MRTVTLPTPAHKTPTLFRCAVALSLAVPASALAADSTSTEPRGPLALDAALALVVVQSPELVAYAYDLRAVEARRLHAGQRTNPEVSLEVEDALGTGAYKGLGRAQTTLQVGQLFELGDKRQASRLLASSVEQQLQRDFELQRITVLTDAATKFAHVVADQHRLALAREGRALAEAALAVAQRRVGSGAASIVEEQRARVLVARHQIAEEHAEHELLSSRRRLAALWGSTDPIFSEAQGDLFARSAIPSFPDIAARVEANPELVRLTSERARRDAEVGLANARATPDLRVTLGARRFEGVGAADDGAFALVAGVALPLPLFKQNEGEIGEARARREKLEKEREATRVATLTALFGQYQELAHVITELDTLEREMLPQAMAMQRTIDEGFKIGRFSQLELVDAQRTLIEVREEHIDAAEEYHRYVASIERLVGGSLVAPTSASPPSAPQPSKESPHE